MTIQTAPLTHLQRIEAAVNKSKSTTHRYHQIAARSRRVGTEKIPHLHPVSLPSLALTSRQTCVAYKLGAAYVGIVSWESWRLPFWPAEGRGAPRPTTKQSAGRRTELSLWSRNEEEVRGAFKALPGDVTDASLLCCYHTPISEISGCCHLVFVVRS